MKKQTILPYFFSALLGFGALSACNQNQKTGAVEDTPTSGNLKMSVDETFAPIIDAQTKVFHKLYKYAKINVTAKPENQVIQDLLNDSARVIVISRELNPTEKATLEKNAQLSSSAIRSMKIATDGVALIVNRDNADTLLTLAQIKAIFSGQTASWKQVDNKSKHGDITIVFDNNGSSTSRFIQDSITGKLPLSAKAFAAKSNPAVIDYVSQNKNAIGVIGMNWISDFDDSTTVKFIKSVNVVAVSREASPRNSDDYILPYQGNLVKKFYPLSRDLYAISREARMGIGTGFASFMAGDKGQRIVLKGGLVPARGVVRIVEVKR